MNDQDLRDCFAMFAMLTQFFRADEETHDAERCYQMADAMLQARKPKEEVGITAIKRTRKKND
jgi:hypothetical protein